jgi:hypothetical protein
MDIDQNQMVAILSGLLWVWKLNEFHADLTIEYIFTELDLDPLAAQMLILEAGPYMTELGNVVRAYALSGRLIRWNVTPYVILLELDDDSKDVYPHSEGAAADGCPGINGPVPLPF